MIIVFVCLIKGHEPNTDVGPVISPEAKNKILGLIQSAVDEGAKILLDGRNISVPGYERGNFVGPTILTDVKVTSFYQIIYFIFNANYSIFWLKLVFILFIYRLT